MLLPDLRKAVLEANLELVRKGLVLYTFGNASAIFRKKSLVVIKPSGVDYATMTPADLVITDLDGNVLEGSLRPSSEHQRRSHEGSRSAREPVIAPAWRSVWWTTDRRAWAASAAPPHPKRRA